MQNKIFIILFLLISTTCYAGDYVCFDQEGKITEKYRSVDGADLIARSDCMKITRADLEALTRWKKVTGGAIVDLTQPEIDAILQAEADAQELAQETAANNLDVTLREAFLAWLQLYNSKVPAQYQVTGADLIQKIKDNR